LPLIRVVLFITRRYKIAFNTFTIRGCPVSIKRPQSRNIDQFGYITDKEGVLQIRTNAFFGAKNFGFFEI